jgi:D-arginine dehydrogenase
MSLSTSAARRELAGTPDRVSTVVIGAGIIGSLTAHEILTRAPRSAVTMIDRDTVGSGASRRSAGLHFPRGSTERVREMSRYSEDFYRKLVKNQPGLPIYSLPQASVITSRRNAQHTAEAYLPQAELVELRALPNPGMRLPNDASLWRIDGCHQADVYGLSVVLASGLRRQAQVREGLKVIALESSDSGVALRLGSGERIAADQAVLAPGPWLAAPAWRELLAPLGMRVKKIVALHVERVPSETDRAIIFHDEDAFLIPLVNRGHWLFSYTCQEWDVDPDALYQGLSGDNIGQARECLRRYSPSLAEDCRSGRVFCDAYSTTGEPQVQTVDPAGRIVFAGAANGSGYRLAPAIASQAVDLLALPVSLRSAG